MIALTDEQQKQAINAEQTYMAWRAAWVDAREYAGGMHWKTVKGREYLYRTHDRKGNAKSLGVRSPDTEALLNLFQHKKQSQEARLKTLADAVQTTARVNAALRLGSAPPVAATLCQRLWQAGLLGKNLLVIGTNSLYAYEALAGVRFESDVTATTDIDLLWMHQAKLRLSMLEVENAESSAPDGLLQILQRADSSFVRLENQNFRAANKNGFLVDLIRQTPKPPWKKERDRMGASNDLVATDIWNMKWLLNAPRIEQIAIATNGAMYPLTVPDPRAFCAFKYWLATSDERDPRKKSRDLAQARAVHQLITERLPHLSNWDEITSIPKGVMTKLRRAFPTL